MVSVKIILASALIVLLGGCASHSTDLHATNVSVLAYKDMSCKELLATVTANTNEIEELARSIDKTADDDQAQAVLGAILFFPALFALEGGDGPAALRFSQLKGEINAIEQSAILAECPKVISKITTYREKVAATRQAEKDKASDNSWN